MLYIMRHGKTDWNVLYKLQGGIDIPLNDEGRKMASDAREEYKDIHFDVCYVSPLCRARETAELFLKGRNIPVIVNEKLREMSFGEFEGTPQVLSRPDLPVYKLFKDPAHYVAVNGAESLESLLKRTGEFLKEVVEPDLKSGKDVLIVGHGALNSAIITQVKNLPIERFWETGIPNCKLFRLDYRF